MERLTLLCESHSARVIEAEIKGSTAKPRLELFVDTVEGVRHELCTLISRELAELGESDPVFQPFGYFEVSSPGVDRPIKFLWQLQQHIGRTVKCTLADKSIRTGLLTSVSETSFTIEKKLNKKDLKAHKKLTDSVEETQEDSLQESMTFSLLHEVVVVIQF